MKKERDIKVTEELLKQLRPFWRELQKIQDIYRMKVARIEKEMVYSG